MTTRDFLIKWFAYGLALLPVWLLEELLFSRYPILGLTPMLLPLAAVAVATLEGASGGTGFALAAGILFDAAQGQVSGVFTLLLALMGLCSGLLSRYFLRQNLIGCFLCSLLTLTAVDTLRVLFRWARGVAAPAALLSLAGRELLLSLCFVPLVYLLFRWVFERVPKATVF